MEDLIQRRFEELEEQHSKARDDVVGGWRVIDSHDWEQWFTSALHLLLSIAPDSPHYGNLKGIYDLESPQRSPDSFWRALGVFQAAKSDFEGGYLFSLKSTISGEIIGDFVNLAKRALNEGEKEVAAVLACAALEDALKRYASLQELSVDNANMQTVVNALKGEGKVSGAQKTLLDVMPKIRDYAMHANWDKITLEDVGSVIGFVEPFLLRHFS